MKSRTTVLVLLACLTLSFMFGMVGLVHAVSPTVKLNLHNDPAAVTLGTGLLNTTTTIMNTTEGWRASAQSTDIVCAANFTTYYNASVDWFLSPRVAGLLTMSSCTATIYINSTKPTTAALWAHLYKNVNGANFSSYSGTSNTTVSATATAFTINMGSGADTLAASSFLFFKFSVCSINDTDTFTVWYDVATMPSRLNMVTVDPLTISLTSDFSTYTTDKSPILTATVTDVWGGYDIVTPTILCGYPPSLAITLTADSYGDTQYSNTWAATVLTPAEGAWTPTATVTDRSGNSYTSALSFSVSAETGPGNTSPSLTLTGDTGTDMAIGVVAILAVCVLIWLAFRSKPKRRRHR